MCRKTIGLSKAENKPLRLASCVSLFISTLAAGIEDDDKQEFLLLVEGAYVQEQGEVQVEVSHEHQYLDSFSTELSNLGFEYGFTDTLTLEVELPHLRERRDENGQHWDINGWNDLEIGFIYQIFEESEGAPAASWGIEVGLPTATAEDGLGKETTSWETFFRMSKQIPGSSFCVHANLSYGFANGIEEYDEDGFAELDQETGSIDEKEFEYGFAVTKHFSTGTTVLLELRGEFETETEEDESETSHQLVLAPGFMFETETGLEFGVGVGFGLTDESPDLLWLIRASYEF